MSQARIAARRASVQVGSSNRKSRTSRANRATRKSCSRCRIVWPVQARSRVLAGTPVRAVMRRLRGLTPKTSTIVAMASRAPPGAGRETRRPPTWMVISLSVYGHSATPVNRRWAVGLGRGHPGTAHDPAGGASRERVGHRLTGSEEVEDRVPVGRAGRARDDQVIEAPPDQARRIGAGVPARLEPAIERVAGLGLAVEGAPNASRGRLERQ